MSRRLEATAIALLALVLVGIPLSLIPPDGGAEELGAVCLLGGALSLAGWRLRPRTVAVLGPLLVLVPLFTGPDPPDLVLLLMLAFFALLADCFEGRLAWAAGAFCAAWLATVYVVTRDGSPGLLILTLPGFLAGTALRLRRQTAEALAERGREIEHERGLFTDLSVRNERARIAGELHDIVGHALSVMVIQASAGQRLVDRSPEAARETLAVIAESARRGREDLQRLIELLGGTDVGTQDLVMVDEMVGRAARSGLAVTCRLEGNREGVATETGHLAYRVVQESLTNALRHAPGSAVRVLLKGGPEGRSLLVRVENDAPTTTARTSWGGSGRGLQGLREGVLGRGGSFTAGPAAGGGWCVEALLDATARQRSLGRDIG